MDENDGVHGRVCAAPSLRFVLVVQARRLLFSASLGWAEEAQKCQARNSDGDAAITEAFSHPLCFRSFRLVVVELRRHYFFCGAIAVVR